MSATLCTYGDSRAVERFITLHEIPVDHAYEPVADVPEVSAEPTDTDEIDSPDPRQASPASAPNRHSGTTPTVTSSSAWRAGQSIP